MEYVTANVHDQHKMNQVIYTDWMQVFSTIPQCGVSQSNVVIAMIPDPHFGSGSGSEPNFCQMGGPCYEHTQTVNLGTVRCKSPNLSGLGGLSADCPEGSSVDLYNVLVLQLDNWTLFKLGIWQPMISFWMFCNLWHWLFWNTCFAVYRLHFWPER
jgi:hypothetical protein